MITILINIDICIFKYRYDKRGNIVKKILPQCQYTQYWYDHGDKVIYAGRKPKIKEQVSFLAVRPSGTAVRAGTVR